MKYSALLLMITAVFCLSGLKANAQAEAEKLDLPGDNLNLYSALKLFQESPTLESFEKALNDEKSNINNLDLNGDNKIDYIRVVDNPEGNVHNITLKIAVSKTEDQDVAVFVVNKESDGKVQIQVIGDEALYGKDYIIEPDFETGTDGAGTPNPGYTGDAVAPDQNASVQTITTSEIASWPVVQFIYVPGYSVWRSPWYWSYYPSYWRPWRPYYWHYYYGYHYHWAYYYNSHYRRWHNYRVPGWRDQYYGSSFRSRSPIVQTRYHQGDYRNTYTRPDLAVNGAAVFKKDFPKAPFVRRKLPSFDNTGRPLVTRPMTSKPATRQVIARPGVKPAVEEPVTSRPTVQPTAERPVTTRPGITKPITTSPTTRPILPKPATEQGETRPVTRPITTNPVITRPHVTNPPARPVTRPVETTPIQKPITRPVEAQPIQRPVSRPVQRPVETRPVTRPVQVPVQRPIINQPVNRTPPPAPRPVTNGPLKPIKE